MLYKIRKQILRQTIIDPTYTQCYRTDRRRELLKLTCEFTKFLFSLIT